MGHRIKDINANLRSINDKANGLGLQTRTANAVFESPEEEETDSFSAEPVYGREKEVTSIVEKLINTIPSPAEQVVRVLPIVGMGGLGKTTLARKVFGDDRIVSHFEHNCVWVHVPGIFNVSNVLKNILEALTNEKFGLESRQGLLQKLQTLVSSKKFFIVLDGVWIEDKDVRNEDWEMGGDFRKEWGGFVNSLMGISSVSGNCMIVTSRSEVVASIVETVSVDKLDVLSDYDCWSIIKANAFNGSRYDPSEFEAIGIKFAEKCRGLPLAAKIIGGLLCKKSRDEWVEIEKKWLSDVRDDKSTISKVLKLSFDHLSPSLKKCFAYCSIFPKGYKVAKEQLIEFWMAEGFIRTEITGSKVFNHLLRNSLLQVAERDDYGNITHCNMHNHVHYLSWSVLCEKDKVMEGVCQSRYIGCQPSGEGLLPIPEGKERYVRTLFYNGKNFDINFSDFKSMRSLILMGSDINELPTSVKELKHLRYLEISDTNITYLPESIGELYHLQTLIAMDVRLPNSLIYLISLRHLHISKYTTLPPEIGKLTSLQTLVYFPVGKEKGCGISELGCLKNLKGILKIINLEEVRDKNEALGADLHRKTGIYVLTLGWKEFGQGGKANDESVLEGLKPHPNLKGLEIFGFKGKSLQLWEGVNNLMKIELSDCSECEELPILGHLRHLKSLFLNGLTNLKSIRSSFYGNINNCRRGAIVVSFSALERLELRNMPNLKEWDEVDFPSPSQVFPCLKYLKVEDCRHLMRAPSHFPCLEELEIDGMESSLALQNICGPQVTSLTCVIIREIEGLECLPDGLFSNNHNLTKLEIMGCTKMTRLVPRLGGGGVPSLRVLKLDSCFSLRELPDDLHSLNSLEKLCISAAPHLKSIPYPTVSSAGGGQQQGFTSLRELDINHCEGLTSLPIEMVESCAPSLEDLRLGWLGNITNMRMLVGCLHKMTRLRYFEIEVVPEFSIKDVYICSHSLQKLTLGAFLPDSSWYAMLRQFTSLRSLELHGLVVLYDLPNQLQHLTSLEQLTLCNYGIESLPEWFENLSSLETLVLSDCQKFRRLPSKQAMQRLDKLTRLYIWSCPLLLKDDYDIIDSEWPKISHIPTIYVDGRLISSGH